VRSVRAAPLLLLFASGGVAVAFEVLWLRGFIALLGATAPAIAATLSGVFLGFALGSRLGAGLARRSRVPWRSYGLLEIAAALAAVDPAPGRALAGVLAAREAQAAGVYPYFVPTTSHHRFASSLGPCNHVFQRRPLDNHRGGADQVGPLEVGVRQGADIHVHHAYVVVVGEQVGQGQ
jgi:hypothetical protein